MTHKQSNRYGTLNLYSIEGLQKSLYDNLCMNAAFQAGLKD